jgi:hypothetical protein
MSLPGWEKRFDSALRQISENERGKAGAVLAAIPGRDEWESFVVDVRADWGNWKWVFTINPGCMVALYDGAAFYNYKSGAFWSDFAAVVGAPPISANLQTMINGSYTKAAKRFGLPITDGNFVGSAVAHIGIPISMWDGFLHVCEWALWTDNWDVIAADAWHEAMTRRLGGRALLIKFLVENRHTAMQFVREMLGARRVLSEDRELTVSEIAQAMILRAEYFEEVPETADFLRPDDPDSLFADRVRLAWSEERQSISLHLPPVHDDLLPAVWRLGDREQSAASTARDFPINGRAFAKTLLLQRVSDSNETQQRIAGIDEWALYDEGGLRFVNHDRDLLPVSQYTLISRHRLAPQLEGWQHDPEEPCIDLESQLVDGTPIFLTKLFAESRRPRLKIGEGRWIEFAQRRGVALRVFSGETRKNAARFSVMQDGTICTELWPRPFLEVPLSLVRDDDISSEFTVFLDGQAAHGKWVTFQYDPPHAEAHNAERAFCFWRWEAIPPPALPVHRTLDALDNQALVSAQAGWFGRHTLHVQSRRLGRLMFGSALECRFELVPRTADSLWPATWDDYIAWVLLSQVQDDATWEEVRIARDAVTMFANISLNAVYYQIRKLERHGYLVARGHRYRDFKCRITLANAPGNAFRGEYCGLTSSLYELVRKVPPLSLAVAPAEPGRPAKLYIEWPQRDRHDVRNACQILGIEAVQGLWNH